MGSCPDTDIDPKKLLRVVLFVSKVFHLDKAGLILFPTEKLQDSVPKRVALQ